MRDPRSSIKRSVRRTATAVRRGALWVDDRALRVETYRRDGSVAEGDLAIAHLPPSRFLRFAFNAVLRRDPDPGAEASYLPRLESGEITPQVRGEINYGFPLPLPHSICCAHVHHSTTMSRSTFHLVWVCPRRPRTTIGGTLRARMEARPRLADIRGTQSTQRTPHRHNLIRFPLVDIPRPLAH